MQSQVDWGQARVWLGAQREVRHIFVLTLGFSRRSVYVPCLSETLGELLDAHEQAFTHFGGYTQEHLYDRPRTVCAPRGTDGVRWNTTFKAFADFWGFEPRLCRPYRAQTKGKVEAAVGHAKKTPLRGLRFERLDDAQAYLDRWERRWADTRIHGTTKRQVAAMFAEERPALGPLPPRTVSLLPVRPSHRASRRLRRDRLDLLQRAARLNRPPHPRPMERSPRPTTRPPNRSAPPRAPARATRLASHCRSRPARPDAGQDPRPTRRRQAGRSRHRYDL